MKITVLGGCGGWPTAQEACSGFLVEQDGFRLLLDLGYAAFPQLLRHTAAERIDAVLISHGHPDHCADLNPLLRARAMSDDRPPALPIFTPAGGLDAVLALDRPGMLDDAYELREFEPGDRWSVGPFEVDTRLLPHWVPNAGMRLSADGTTLAYTGDSGPSPEVAVLARDADLLIAEATYPENLRPEDAPYLTSALEAGRQAAQAGAARLLLTHLWPGTDPEAALAAARRNFTGPLDVAVNGLTVEL